MQVGLLGGTFDPMHKGHLNLLETAMRCGHLDAVVVMPAGSPYHKKNQLVSPAVYRYELCKRSLKPLVHTMLSDMEILRESESYTIDTVEALEKTTGSEERIALIYGSDILFTILDWKEPEKLLSKTVLLVARRPEDNVAELEERAEQLRKTYHARIRFIEEEQVPISSTRIRRAVRLEQRFLYEERCQLVFNYLASEENKKPQYTEFLDTDVPDLSVKRWDQWLNPKVADFIRKNELYLKEVFLSALKPETQNRLVEIERQLFKLISRKRLIHSWNVLFLSVELALRFSVDPDKAALAALCHDAAKELSREELLFLVPKEKRAQYRKLNPAILHGPAGASLVDKIFGIKDEDIKSAIYYHTTLHDQPTQLEKILFLADKIEPGREYKDLAPIRKLSKKHLNAATVACLKDVERFLLRENLKPHPLSKAAMHSLISEIKSDGSWPDKSKATSKSTNKMKKSKK